jgi:hypothetical protein
MSAGLIYTGAPTYRSDAPVLAHNHKDGDSSITVAAYYFGHFHPNEPREIASKGKGWSEWELLKAAKPRFPGHHQPLVPLWGYDDETDPRAMARKIDAAADHGINAFIFDWYFYNDGPFLEAPLDHGFLKAANRNRLKFALMWANHNWTEIHPYKKGTPQKLLYPGAVTPTTFDKLCDHVIRDYFLQPNYWRIDGKPYFSFYDLSRLIESFGSTEAARAALDRFREKAKAAGLPGLHLNAVAWGRPILPGETQPVEIQSIVRQLGFDSVTSYTWIHHAALPTQTTEYDTVRDEYFQYWDKAEKTFDVPYFPNVTMGWDPSPRADQSDTFDNSGYPFTNTITDNTPEKFRDALLLTKQKLLESGKGPQVVTVNAWNEWSEGSYLEPDTVHRMQYLDAVKDVFARSSRYQFRK